MFVFLIYKLRKVFLNKNIFLMYTLVLVATFIDPNIIIIFFFYDNTMFIQFFYTSQGLIF